MNKEQQIEALRIARMVRNGNLNKATGARLLSENANIRLGSASIIISVYINMGKGQVLTRTLSASDMVFFLEAISVDEGADQLKNALTALQLHIRYRESAGANPIQSKEILARYQARLRDIKSDSLAIPVYLNDLQLSFNNQVESLKVSSRQERLKRLSKANKLPNKVARLVYVFERNVDVVVEVLHRADGHCESCKTPAPFNRKSNGTPYLEVHHKVQLAENGEDTVENAIALCPNCHRQFHYG